MEMWKLGPNNFSEVKERYTKTSLRFDQESIEMSDEVMAASHLENSK